MLKILCSQLGCTNKARKDGVGTCHVHGPHKRCSYQDCNNLERQGGLCVRHGSKKKTCTTSGCNKNAVKGGACVGHGAKRPCMIVDCVRNLFKDKRCRYHYRCSLGDSGFSDWDPSITRVMGMDMLGFECLASLGMAKNNTG